MNLFAFRMPRTQEVKCGMSHRTLRGVHPDSFIAAPFCGGKSSIISIPADDALNLAELNDLLNIRDEKTQTFPSTPKEEHFENIRQIIKEINSGNLEKCVCSRIITEKGKVNIKKTFENLCSAYPEAFVFLFHTQESGTWMGASPELLLSRRNDKICSMALAGTRPTGTQGEWNLKNLKEHEPVVQFIVSIFTKFNLNLRVLPTVTKEAGPVEHLMTLIKGEITKEPDVKSLLDALSPTPALSGVPREKAMETIKKTEKFNRNFYGGYCGWIESNAAFDIFVNLRSMIINNDNYSFFAGGGIMKDSDPSCEWEETENKAETLKSQIIT